MREDSTRKPAWNVQKGEVIVTRVGDREVPERVLSVLRMEWTGELNGVAYQRAPVVRLELREPGNWFMEAGDTLFEVRRPQREKA